MEKQKKRRVRPIRRNETTRTPYSIHSIHDLIRVSQTGKIYSNLNTEMLWKITPQLIDIDNMVGMKELKTTLFYQIIYYLQDLFIDDSREYLHTVITGAPGTGKCLGKDTKVLLYDGALKNVQDLTMTDVLLGDDSTPRHIQNLCQGQEDLYKIHTPTYTYVVNASHILSCINEKGEFIDLCLTDVLSSETPLYGYKVSYELESPVSSEVDPYILGYALTSLQQQIPTVRLRQDAAFQYFSSFQAVTRVAGTFEYKLNLSLFQDWMFSPDALETYLLHLDNVSQYVLLSGFLDAHDRDYDHYEITLYLPQTFFVTTILLRLLDKLGIAYHTSPTSYTAHDQNLRLDPVLVELTIETGSIPNFLHEHNWCPPNRRQVLSFPMTIEPIGQGDYYGFELDGNQRFLLENGTVTHNTTIAKLIGEMYKNMGILSPDGVFRVAKREDFVAEYLGQTAIKTKKLLEQCKGGVLFIDEVYALGPGKKDTDSFSKEAIDTLNVFLSEHHNTFCCIIAGYEEDIKHCFFSVNQGLERRFQWSHHIGEYSNQDLVDIFFKLLSESCWTTSIEPEVVLGLVETHSALFQSFGGSMENLVTKCKMAHAKRLLNCEEVKKHELTNDDAREGVSLMNSNRLNLEEKPNPSLQNMYV